MKGGGSFGIGITLCTRILRGAIPGTRSIARRGDSRWIFNRRGIRYHVRVPPMPRPDLKKGLSLMRRLDETLWELMLLLPNLAT